MPRNLQPQREQIQAADPYYGEYSRLAEQFQKGRGNKPIYSAGQGIAEVLGDVGEAYFLRKAAEKQQAAQSKDYSDVAMAQRFAMDSGLAKDPKSGALYSAQDFGGLETQGISPMSAQQRAAAAIRRLSDVNPRMGVTAAPGMMDLAKQFAPEEKKYGAPIAAAGPDGKPTFIRPEEGGAGYTTMSGITPPAQNETGEWAISAADGKPKYVSKKDLLGAPGQYLPVPTGMRIASDGQGGFEITTGGQEPQGLTKPTQTKIEDTILTGRDALARLNAIKSKAKPEYQQYGTRWANTWASVKDKAGIQLDPKTKQDLYDFTGYRREVVANTNQTIKDLTGATVSESEAPRLMQQMPVAGQGLFDGDGPTEFDAKLKGTTDSITSSIARAEYARKNGLNKDQQFAIPLETIPQLIEQKGNAYADELSRANPQASPEQVQEMVKSRLREEFGL